MYNTLLINHSMVYGHLSTCRKFKWHRVSLNYNKPPSLLISIEPPSNMLEIDKPPGRLNRGFMIKTCLDFNLIDSSLFFFGYSRMKDDDNDDNQYVKMRTYFLWALCNLSLVPTSRVSDVSGIEVESESVHYDLMKVKMTEADSKQRKKTWRGKKKETFSSFWVQ